MEPKEIAAEILRQLGGNKFKVMTGAKNFAFDADGSLSFRLPKYNGVKINYVKIKLNGNDLYDIEFGRIYGMKYNIIGVVNDVYFDQLPNVFTEKTGLATRL